MSNDHIDFEPNELGEYLRRAIKVPLSPPILDRDSATFDPTKFA
jgi:hypothetical protein